MHISALPDRVVEILLSLSIPKVVKLNKQRYRFLFPEAESNSDLEYANADDLLLWKSGNAIEMKNNCPHK